MGMSTSAWCSQGPCLMPTLRQLWGGQLGMWWLSASKPSQEGCDTFHHEKDPHWQHTRCWWWGALHHTPHAAASHAQNLFWGQGTHSHPLSHRKRDWSGKKCAKRQFWVQDLGPGGAGSLWSSLEGRQCLLQHQGWRWELQICGRKNQHQRVCGPFCWERQGESLGKLQARVGEELFWMWYCSLFLSWMINLSPKGLRHSDKSLQGWSKQPFPALSSSKHCTTTGKIALTSPLERGIVDSCAGNRAPEKIQCIPNSCVRPLALSARTRCPGIVYWSTRPRQWFCNCWG